MRSFSFKFELDGKTHKGKVFYFFHYNVTTVNIVTRDGPYVGREFLEGTGSVNPPVIGGIAICRSGDSFDEYTGIKIACRRGCGIGTWSRYRQNREYMESVYRGIREYLRKKAAK